MRSAGGTNFGLPDVVVLVMNSTIAVLAGPSFQEGSGSVCAAAGSAATSTQTHSANAQAGLFMGPLVARVAGLLHLFEDAGQVVGLRRLERRELLVRHQVSHPQLLADGQHVPVVLERGRRSGERTANAHARLLVDADRLLEGVALDVLHQRE